MKCTQCEHFKIIDGEDLCTRAKCMKTSKQGKTLTWRMTYIYRKDPVLGILVPDEKSSADVLREEMERKEKAPCWCPINKDLKG